MQRLTLGGIDLSVIDPHERDTRYIYDEVFINQIYYHPDMRMPRFPMVIDVGANIGLYSIWAARRYQPKAIYCYEASPLTYAYLVEDTAQLIDPEVTKVHTVNRAIASAVGQPLLLHQSPLVSGISTLLAPDRIGWVASLARSNELVQHDVVSTTVSAEIAAHGLTVVDMLKIDVEGYFLEVLKGVSEADYARIQNIVIEVDYYEEVGVEPKDVAAILAKRGFTTDIDDLTLYAWKR
jgi:FkbM family methyltransferase